MRSVANPDLPCGACLQVPEGWKLFRKLIQLVDVKMSEASVESDRMMILRRIEQTTGFDMTNSLIRGAIAGCEYCQKIREVQEAALGVPGSYDWQSMDLEQKRGHHECTLLMAASGGGFIDVARQLLAGGADPNAAGKNGKTALMYASRLPNQHRKRHVLPQRPDQLPAQYM